MKQHDRKATEINLFLNGFSGNPHILMEIYSSEG